MTTPEKTALADRTKRSARVKVWDLAVRLFHWSLVLAFAIAWISAEEWDRAHELAGYFIGGLLIFRVIWGVIGPKYARFANFIYKPSTVHAHLRDTIAGRARRYLGHNPLGGAMVIALIVSLIGVTVTGIAMTTNMFWGVEWMEELHEITANMVLILVALHVAGVVFSSFEHRENLVKSMMSGLKHRSTD